MFFWNSLAFSMIQQMLTIWSLVPLPFSKTSLNIWKFTVHVLLKPGLENFEHYFASTWDECNCVVVWAFFGTAFLWDWMKTDLSQSCPTLCDPMDCSTPGLPVHHQLPEFTQTHVHWVSDAIQPSHPLLPPSPPALNLFQHQGLSSESALGIR